MTPKNVIGHLWQGLVAFVFVNTSANAGAKGGILFNETHHLMLTLISQVYEYSFLLDKTLNISLRKYGAAMRGEATW